MFNFLKTFGTKKLENSIQKAGQSIALSDLDTAADVNVDVLQKNLDKIALQYQNAVKEYQREQREADQAEHLFNTRISAAEKLSAKLEGELTDTDKMAIEQALNQLLTEIEDHKPEVEREKQEAVEAKEFMDMLKKEVDESANQLKSARKNFDSATKNLKRNELQAEQAKRKEEQIKELAGIKKKTDNLSFVLNAMNQKADEAKAQAEASKLKADLLKPVKVEDNDIIKQAMLEASGTAPKSTNMADRLAALKN